MFDELDLLFGAVADSTRRGVLQRLAQGPATAGQLASLFAISRPSVSRHVGVLARAGLVKATEHGRHVWYETTAERLDPGETWIRDLRKRATQAPRLILREEPR